LQTEVASQWEDDWFTAEHLSGHQIFSYSEKQNCDYGRTDFKCFLILQKSRMCATQERGASSPVMSQSTPGGTVYQLPPHSGLEFLNKLVLIFMKRLHALWYKWTLLTRVAISPQTYNLLLGVGKVYKINLIQCHTLAAQFISDPCAVGILNALQLISANRFHNQIRSK
jgi:hypothetical protein